MGTEVQNEKLATETSERKRSSFKWSGAARNLVREHPEAGGRDLRQLITKLQKETGYPRRACRLFFKRFGLSLREGHNKWTQENQDELLSLLEQHTVCEAARILARSPKSLYGMLYRLGRSARLSHDWFSVPSLAEALYVSHEKIRSWIRKGWLRATHKKIGARTWTMIKPDDFGDFCRRHTKEVVGNRLHRERLEFVYRFVFPPSHAELLPVRSSKKERAAFEVQMMNEASASADDNNDNLEDIGSEARHPWDRIA